MKVVFVHPSYPNQFTGISQALGARNGWDCSFLVNEAFAEQIRRARPSIAYYGFREETITASGTYYTQSLEEGARRGKAVVEALAHIQASAGVDLVVGHASFGTTFFIRQLLRIPVVSYVELPGHFPMYCRSEFPVQYPQTLIDVSLRALINASVLQSDRCIVPSRHAWRLFPRDLRHKLRVQMEGFSLPPPVEDRRALRESLGIFGPGPVVGFAGRTLEAVRGFDIFVKVAKSIRGALRDAQFLILGDELTLYGNETMYLGGKSFKRHVLDAEGMTEDGFLFRPYMPHDQFVKHLQAMDLILFPLFEGAANWGLFEAMAAGVPILASDRCFVPEAITHGREGLLFDPRDVDGFSRAALAILSQPERYGYLARNARTKIARQFSLERAASGYASILKEAVEVSRKTNGTRQSRRVGGPVRHARPAAGQETFGHRPGMHRKAGGLLPGAPAEQRVWSAKG